MLDGNPNIKFQIPKLIQISKQKAIQIPNIKFQIPKKWSILLPARK